MVKCLLTHSYEQTRDNVENIYLKALANGLLQTVNYYNGYNQNGFRFHTFQRGTPRFSNNSGVCVKGTNYMINETDNYGQLQEVVELDYLGWPIKRTILFKCEWFDITPNVGMRIHKQYKLVDVNHTRRYAKR